MEPRGKRTELMGGTVTFLRAELVCDGTTIVGHTTELTPNRAFIRTDEMLGVGSSVDLTFSFRAALPPLRFRGVVTEHRLPAGPGNLGGLWLSLHAESAEDRDRLQSVFDASSTRPIRVLMVDDSSLTRDVFRHWANRTSSRISIEAAADADLAWSQLETGDYHVLLVDHFLPSSTGAELIQRIRSEPRLSDLPIVGISIGGRVARDAMLKAGVDVFLEKPVQARDFLATLERLGGLGGELSA